MDEFQDTSALQMDILILLKGVEDVNFEHRNSIMIVGDPDQSIYSWRGASNSNLDKFKKSFPEFKHIVLDVNYRSSKKIISACSEILKEDTHRVHAIDMKGASDLGTQVSLYICLDANKEALFVASKIRELKEKKNLKWSDFAILYRSNSNQQTSNLFEKALKFFNIPFSLSSGRDFYSRKPLSDILCFLRFFF